MAPAAKPNVKPMNAPDMYEVEDLEHRGVWFTVVLNPAPEPNKCTCAKGARGRFCEHMKAALDAKDRAEQQEAGTLEEVSAQLGAFFQKEEPRYKGARQRQIDKLGYEFGEVVSALQKEIRRGDEEAAVFWGTLLYEASPYYLWRRLLVIAAEDVGFGSPETVTLVNALASGWKLAKEGAYGLSGHAPMMAIMAMCRAPKSTEVEDLQSLTIALIGKGQGRPILPEYIDGHTKRGKAAGATWDQWYADRHRRFKMPVNRYTEMLWQMEPSWRPKEEER